MAINFVGRDRKDKTKFSEVKRVVMVWTTVILGMYVVAWSGWLGWNYYLTSRLTQNTVEEGELTARITKLADREVLAGQVFTRSLAVAQALDQKKLEALIPVLESEGVTVGGWNYGRGKQSVTVSTGDPEELEKYIEDLKKFYPTLKAGTISWLSGGEWMISIQLEEQVND